MHMHTDLFCCLQFTGQTLNEKALLTFCMDCVKSNYEEYWDQFK